MDPELSRRYLHAMGVPVWRPRETDMDTPEPEEIPPPHEGVSQPAIPDVLHEEDGMIGESAKSAAVEPEPPGRVSPKTTPDAVQGGTAIFNGDQPLKMQESGHRHVPIRQSQSPGMVFCDTLPDGGTEPPPQAAPDVAPGDGVAGMDWERLSATVASCRACGLCETRTQTVFGIGNRQADLMIIGEAPGADEDRQGEPFVGRAGQLLNLMLAAIGLQREQVFIANILKCRPPQNRDPRPEEALRCSPYLMRQIALVRPRVLLSVGRISAQKLLETDRPIGKLRGRWFVFGPDETPLTVTFHPAYLLRSPDQKAKAWQDLIKVARRLREAQENPGAEPPA